MPRSIAEIDNDIAKVKAEIALKNKYMNGYAAPTSNRGWGAYFQGDRTVHQKALDDQTAWARALEQQEFQAAQADENRRLQEAEGEANRKNAREIASMNNSNIQDTQAINSRAQLEADLAQAEYDDAISRVDLDKPETILAAKKAALKLNYANSNLPYFDKEVHIVPTTFESDAEPVAKTKRINTAVSYLDTLKDVDYKRWTPEERANYEAHLETLKKDAPDLVKKYQVELDKKGETTEDKERAELKELRRKRDNKENMTGDQRRRLKSLEAKYK